MAVYERTYRAYDGPRTPTWSHFLVIPRYAYREVFKTRVFTLFFGACFMLPIFGLIAIYLHHNLDMLRVVGLADLGTMFPIDERAFHWFLRVQGPLGFLLTLIVAPSLISADLRNNALPLYLARPFSRTEYLLGKLSVLIILLSAISWIPGLALYGMHGYLTGGGWLSGNLRIAFAVFVGSWLGILVLSLIALSVSAWVKWKPIASAVLVGIFLVGAGMGKTINDLLDTRWGILLNVPVLVLNIWEHLFQGAPSILVPLWVVWSALAVICGLCLVMLNFKLRAYEVTS